ncbi:uncharacterized protein LOC134532039 [Bacillus rossius redtenbacheri]|uniref:uncharacterized protein LOC134532039 n=1 Tax=Bacillus rossius redtenbacheri TaxID=93214 RepID=UPI002FDDD6EF
MMIDDPDDPLEQCPLQKSHMIRRSRMAVHLAKCVVATNPGSELVQCLYDSTHWVKQPLLHFHMTEQCDKRELFEKFVLQPDAVCNPNPSPLTQRTELPPPEEDWDDGPLTGYDPSLKASSEAVLRTICVAPKSKRREFRQHEVERFQELAQQGKVGMSVSGRAREPLAAPAPLRQPRAEVSQVIGAGRGAPCRGEASEEVERAMGRLKLDQPPGPADEQADGWVAVGRGSHKKERREARQPEPRAPGFVVSGRDAIAVPRGRGKFSSS